MRISDWSSDVCSSDLGSRTARAWMRFACPRLRVEETLLVICRRGIAEHTVHHPRVGVQFVHHGFTRRHQVADLPADRKSVVSGKSVSVRVDLGGRRLIQNKTYNNT